MSTKETTRKNRRSSSSKEPRSKTSQAPSNDLAKQEKGRAVFREQDVPAQAKPGPRKLSKALAGSAVSQRSGKKVDGKKPVRRRSRTTKAQPGRNGRESEVPTGEPSGRIDQIGARIAAYLYSSLDSHARTNRLGRVTGPTRFDWGEIQSHELHPDIAYVSFDRWAPYRNVPMSLTWHVVPDLVVEILRDSRAVDEVETRLHDYFHAGVNRVWVVHPQDFKIVDYQSPSACRTLQFDECIDGGTLLQGFQLPLREVANGTRK